MDAPRHLAVIPDGNGRWAAARLLPRTAGYAAGARAVYRLLRGAAEGGVPLVTLFAFSSDNWERGASEVSAMLRTFEEFLAEQSLTAQEHGLRLSVLGRRDRLPDSLRRAMAAAEEATAENRGLHLRLAMDYSARDAILRAACRMYTSMEVSREAFARRLRGMQAEEPSPDVDLLIRTGGEQRLSDFLLWECAYAELYFTPTLWPDFTEADLQQALAEFSRRDRRFGKVRPAEVTAPPGVSLRQAPLEAVPATELLQIHR
jgi:undecaprenyl diphosphate synthase